MIEDSYKQRGLRNKLIKILEKKGIKDVNLLKAMSRVPRHAFFDEALLIHAYEDKAFPIGENQTISQPYTVAFQTEKADIKQGEKVLEIGTGSGYQVCILLEMGAKVYTIEYNKFLYERAKKALYDMGYNPRFFLGDGSEGLPCHAPFDKIIVTAGAPTLPNSLIGQLVDKGVLIIPVGNQQKQRMMRIQKRGEIIHKESFDYFSFVPLLGKFGWQV